MSRRALWDRLALFSWHRPWVVAAVAGVAVVATALSALGLRLRSDVQDLAPHEITAALGRLERDFGILDQLLLLLEAEGDDADVILGAFADELEGRLENEPLVREVQAGVGDVEALLLDAPLLESALLWAGDDDREELRRALSPEGLASALSRQAALLDLPGASQAERWLVEDPFDTRRFVVGRLDAAATARRFRPGSRRFLSVDGRSLLVRVVGAVRSSDPDAVRALIAAVDRATDETRSALGERGAGVRVRRAGGYAVAADTERVMRRDLERNVTGSVLLVLVVLLVAWRRPTVVLLAALPILVGIVVGFGAFTLLEREIVVLALVSGAVLAALGIDFTIHVLEPLRRPGELVSCESVVASVSTTGRSLALAAVTTALAFLSFVLVSDGFLRDMGLLTALGIGACCLATWTVLPAILAALARCGLREIGAPARSASWVAMLARLSPAALCGRLAVASASRPRVVVAIAVVALLAGAAELVTSPPRVEADLRRLQPADAPSALTEERLRAVFGGVADPVLLRLEARAEGGDGERLDVRAVEARVLDAVARAEAELAALRARGLVLGWTSPLAFVPPPSAQRAAIEELGRSDPDAVVEAARGALAAEGFVVEELAPALARLAAAVRRREVVLPSDLVGTDIGARVGELVHVDGARASVLLAVQPAEERWIAGDRQPLFEALDGVIRASGVEGEVSGLHAASAEASGFVVRHFLEATGLALLVVVLVVSVLIRRPALVVAALAPVGIGCVLTLVVWNLLDLRLHFMNVGILPMVLGIGVDDGIHLVGRFLTDGARDARRPIRDTVPAVVLTTLTTLAAFGTLAFSASPGLASVGLLCALGVSFSLLGSVTVLPAILALVARRS